MNHLFNRLTSRPRLVFFIAQQQQKQCITTASLLTKSSRSSSSKTTKQQGKRKSPTPVSSLVTPPPLKQHKSTIFNQPAVFQQCAGLRLRDGKPCQRRITVDPRHATPSTLAYCHDHRPLVTTTTTASTTTPNIESSSTPLPHSTYTDTPPATHYLTSTSLESTRSIASPPIYDCWSLWIGKHIGPRKRKQIRQEMIKPISIKDEAGYLYAYHLTHGPRVSTQHYCYFKIGRSINPTRRVLQVVHKCNYQPKLLDIIPSKHPYTKKTVDDVRMRKCPISHRVERLVHLELEALYPSTGGFKCQGCGTTHREWFRVKRPLVQVQKDDNGGGNGGEQWRRMTDQEVWMTKIRPVMLHWIRYGVAVSALQQAVGLPSLNQ